MIEVRKKSVVPIYAVAAVFLLFGIVLPLYRTWHFIVLACAAVICYGVLSKIFPGKTEFVKTPQKPVETGDAEIDALLREGDKTVAEMKTYAIPKLSELITVTERIFARLHSNPEDFKQIRRFSQLHLPTVMKILKTHDNFSKNSVRGENVKSTLAQIDSALDSIIDSFKKFYDSLYYHQALDIETDIHVLEAMLKKEGFTTNDF